MNESISTSAGAPHGQFLHPTELRSWIRAAGRIPVERSTTYKTLRVFEQEPMEPEAELGRRSLRLLRDADRLAGIPFSRQALIRLSCWRRG